MKWIVLRMKWIVLRMKWIVLRMKWIVLRMKILQNNIFASPKCRTSRMILPQISTITATDEYPECRIHEISEAVFVRKNTY
jgi:hypothetical protein